MRGIEKACWFDLCDAIEWFQKYNKAQRQIIVSLTAYINMSNILRESSQIIDGMCYQKREAVASVIEGQTQTPCFKKTHQIL